MKNVRENQLKKAIYLSSTEYKEILSELFNRKIEVEIALDGISYSTPDNFELNTDDLHERLAKYFDVKNVSSIHADDVEWDIGIWVIYQD